MKYTMIPVSDLRPFEENPFRQRDGIELEMLTESIKENGVLEPIIVRLSEIGEYEIVSGHRRTEVCRELGITEIPAVVKELSRNEALICLVDANLHRENLLPSEKAFAYKMKLDAQKALGRQGAQVVHPGKSRDIVAEGAGTSRETIRRYIRLTFLEKELLDLVDQGRIALTPAVELSYLPKEVPQEIAEIYETDEVTPSYSQSVRLRKLFENGELAENGLYEILSEQKANQKEYLRLDSNKYDRYLGRFRSVREKEDFIAEALEYYNRYLIRQRDRDSR